MSSSAVKVSVVVPVYNPGAYIEECIASILRQSLPSDEYEAIFVDDGSTDGTDKRLDAVAAEHENISVIHIPNSGWPGKPRNVGMDAAKGKYVYFVDNDDWIGDEALERLYDGAERNRADVVVGKEVGHGMSVPPELFRRNVDDAALVLDPLHELLTPHKLFRRAFLVERGIRFPEGRRRLDDHVFVLKCFFSSHRISILSDYPFYHWRRRDDAGNATFRYAEPHGYYQNIREVLDVIDHHVEPGLERDRLYAYWYTSRGLHRLRGTTWAGNPSVDALEILAEIRRLAFDRIGPGVVRVLPARFRVLDRSVRADRVDLIQDQARIERGIRANVALTCVNWTDWRLRLSITAGITYADGTPIALERRSGRLCWAPPPPLGGDPLVSDEDLDVTAELARTSVGLVLRNRHTKVEYSTLAKLPRPVGAGADEDAATELIISTSADAEVDFATVAAGQELGPGIWDLFVYLHSCGWSATQRLPGIGRGTGPPRLVVDPYVTAYGNLSLRVKDTAGEDGPGKTHPLPDGTAAELLVAAWRLLPALVKRRARPLVLKVRQRWRRGQ